MWLAPRRNQPSNKVANLPLTMTSIVSTPGNPSPLEKGAQASKAQAAALLIMRTLTVQKLGLAQGEATLVKVLGRFILNGRAAALDFAKKCFSDVKVSPG